MPFENLDKFDLLFQALKRHLKVQERTFCCISTGSFTLKDYLDQRIDAISTRRNTDCFTTGPFILYVTSARDKFALLLHHRHWLCIYAYAFSNFSAASTVMWGTWRWSNAMYWGRQLEDFILWLSAPGKGQSSNEHFAGFCRHEVRL